MSDVFLAQGVNPEAILNFVKDLKNGVNGLHRMSIYQSNKCIAQVCVPPYQIEEKQQLFSMSKSFTSTAMGICYDRGLITPKTKLVDIFPDKVPSDASEYLLEMTLWDIMTMTSGHKECYLPKIKDDDDIVKSFMECPIDFKPGTHFAYSTACTYVMSAIIKKLTGLNTFDILATEIFPKLGIEGVWFENFKDRNSQGGVGVHASVDDCAKLIMLYANDGVWNGERILSSEWVKMATTRQSDSQENGTPDWSSGYGYQFWINAREGFRADGASGQLGVYLPSKDLVIAIHAYQANMQDEVDALYKMADTLFDESLMTTTELEDAIEELYALPEATKVEGFEGLYKFEDNKAFITLGYFEKKDDSISFVFSDGTQWQRITAGAAKYIEGEFEAFKMRPTLYHLCENGFIDKCHFKAYYEFDGEELRINLMYLDVCYPYTMIIKQNGDELTIDTDCYFSSADARHFVAKRIK